MELRQFALCMNVTARTITAHNAPDQLPNDGGPGPNIRLGGFVGVEARLHLGATPAEYPPQMNCGLAATTE